MTVRVDPKYDKLYKLACKSGDDDLIQLTMEMYVHARTFFTATDLYDWGQQMVGYVAFEDTEKEPT